MAVQRDDPILVLGMHRSGTTMLARMLESLGVFMGRHLEQNHEALAFLDINDRILSSVHAAWDRPTGMLDLLDHEALVEAMTQHMRRLVNKRAFANSYYGVRRVWRAGAPDVWGFKDPRTTVTWPLWRKLFPRARAVYIRRHGVDVAASLCRREREVLRDRKLFRFVGSERMRRFTSIRCLTLEGAFALWRETHEIHRAHLARDPEMQIREVR